MLVIEDLSHSYGGHPALRDVGLTVPDGQLLSIVGPSGCGKSTLLRCVAGLTRAESGRITVDGTIVDGVPDGLAVVFQDYSRSLLPWLSAAQNVALPLRRSVASRKERRETAARMLELVGLPDAARRHPWQLSGGMQQRVAIARALACGPSLLLMDEPFGSVDAQTREELEDLLLAVRDAEGATILVVTHDVDESVYIGDRVVVLSPRPGTVRSDLPVDLPRSRDQIATRRLPEFVELRTEVSRQVRRPAAAPAKDPP
ncbi:ABC transporter ATP-binding protein [Streptomyces sp. HNM0575]|uniref:ATP-binding cassette domain-containing protein n=1 Tax=Streptomyces sp. HNM0575 TaxID=2716338 RepID=UPI00145E9310|nr:ABC transporter ATP-binding protein [Streptomyces sp. HNM0575]